MGRFGRSSQEKTPKKKLISNESEPSPEQQRQPLIQPQPQPQPQPFLRPLPQVQPPIQPLPQVQPPIQPLPQVQPPNRSQRQWQSQIQHLLEDVPPPGPELPPHVVDAQSYAYLKEMERAQAIADAEYRAQLCDQTPGPSKKRSQSQGQSNSRPQSQGPSHSHPQYQDFRQHATPSPPSSPSESSDSTPSNKLFAGAFNMRRINQLGFTVMQKYQLDKYQWVIVARNKLDPKESLAIRLRVGEGGYRQWLNEVCFYMLPKLQHENILPFAGSDKTKLPNLDRNQFSSQNLLEDTDELYESDSFCSSNDSSLLGRDDRFARPSADFWMLNDYGGCITLRHYLMMHTITWPQLIKIMRGIMSGLDYLHEWQSYRFKRHRVLPIIDNFIHSTAGALKKVRFMSSGNREISMIPPLLLTIVHRNLTSLNIVLREDFTPCIWNFGVAEVYHPFQTINHEHTVTRPIKNLIMSSPYSPPEVLKERGVFTLPSMKAIDMYATGIILWELMTRCVLPKLEGATPEENLERGDPDGYCQPFQFEFRCPNALLSPFMLRHAVCRLRTRPFVKRCWLIGRKTNRMVQTMRELWDHDPEARISASTVIERLDKTSGRDHDRPYKYNVILERAFDLDNPQMWPAKTETHMAPLVPDIAFQNMVVEDLATLDEYETMQLRELAESSDSDLAQLLGGCCFRIR